MLSGRSLVRAQRCRGRDRPSRRGGSAVPVRCVERTPPAARHATRLAPQPLLHNCHTSGHMPPPAATVSPARGTGKHSLFKAPAHRTTGEDRPSGGLRATDRPWCQFRQGGLCSTSIDTTLRSTSDIQITLADPSPREPGTGSRAQLWADCSQAAASAACRSERPRSNRVAEGRGLNTPRPRTAQAGC